jgi:hypothetical protein
MIFVYHEGMPRAHLPALVWSSGKTLPHIEPDDERHDSFWRSKLYAAPKFSLEADVYAELSGLLMKLSDERKSPYVVEFLIRVQAICGEVFRYAGFSASEADDKIQGYQGT